MIESKKKYGLAGFPLGHSFSRDFFNAKFIAENINAEYDNFEIPNIEILPSIIESDTELCGLNVTIPHKETVMRYLDEVHNTAKEIGAVNTIKITRKGNGSPYTIGYNTDVTGFSASLRPLLQPQHEKALILGSGGASKAVRYALARLDIDSVIVSRNPSVDQLGYKDLTESVISSHKLIVNTTPVGTWPDTESAPDIPYQFISQGHLCYDLIYNPDVTLFMRLSAEKGANVKNGAEMLKLQALAAWDIWNDNQIL